MMPPGTDEDFPAEVMVDGYTCKDICWLLGAVEAFARSGPLGAAIELAQRAGPHLSADGLANIAYELRLRLWVEGRP